MAETTGTPGSAASAPAGAESSGSDLASFARTRATEASTFHQQVLYDNAMRPLEDARPEEIIQGNYDFAAYLDSRPTEGDVNTDTFQMGMNDRLYDSSMPVSYEKAALNALARKVGESRARGDKTIEGEAAEVLDRRIASISDDEKREEKRVQVAGRIITAREDEAKKIKREEDRKETEARAEAQRAREEAAKNVAKAPLKLKPSSSGDFATAKKAATISEKPDPDKKPGLFGALAKGFKKTAEKRGLTQEFPRESYDTYLPSKKGEHEDKARVTLRQVFLEQPEDLTSRAFVQGSGTRFRFDIVSYTAEPEAKPNADPDAELPVMRMKGSYRVKITRTDGTTVEEQLSAEDLYTLCLTSTELDLRPAATAATPTATGTSEATPLATPTARAETTPAAPVAASPAESEALKRQQEDARFVEAVFADGENSIGLSWKSADDTVYTIVGFDKDKGLVNLKSRKDGASTFNSYDKNALLSVYSTTHL